MHTHLRTNTHTRPHTHEHTHTHINKHTHTHPHAHTHKYTHTHQCTHMQILKGVGRPLVPLPLITASSGGDQLPRCSLVKLAFVCDPISVIHRPSPGNPQLALAVPGPCLLLLLSLSLIPGLVLWSLCPLPLH